MLLKENWSHSRVTWNGGTSYSVGGTRFVKGSPKPVTSRAVRKAIDGVDGFLIEDFHTEDPKPKKVVKSSPVAPVDSPEGETDSEPAPTSKKKTVKKKKVKKVKGAKNA